MELDHLVKYLYDLEQLPTWPLDLKIAYKFAGSYVSVLILPLVADIYKAEVADPTNGANPTVFFQNLKEIFLNFFFKFFGPG